MILASGTKLGPYEILSPLGAGGMGEVYKARDTRLGREVAVKVLPSHLSENPEFRQRFEREAKAISQLSHPHICALYDVGNQDGVEYLVMELLEGETLADRLAKGALPLEQTLRFGAEIADALDKAHRQGIVHRDLKPGNVMLTKSGVKLLDFGLAKVAATPLRQSSLTALPTQQGLTEEGTILGTFQYMAPEQLEGKEADARTDIFAFGCVLYEMATGKKAFSGSSQASLITAIMSVEPPAISSLRSMTPPAFDRTVRACLAKDPEERWQSARDVMSELKWIDAMGSNAKAVLPAQDGNRIVLPWAVAALAVLSVIALGIAYARHEPKPARVVRSRIDLPEGFQVASLELSPDGRLLALAGAADADGKQRQPIYLKPLESVSAQPLAGTEGATYPFWSPDGKSIAFFANGKLKRTDVSGGPVQTICDAPQGRGGTWGPAGAIVFAPSRTGPLAGVSASGGSPAAAEASFGAEETHRGPRFLPDGKSVLFYSSGSSRQQESGIYALDLETKRVRLVARESSEGRFIPPGYLAFVRDRNLMVQRFDPKSLRLSGEAIVVAERMRSLSSSPIAAKYSFGGTDLLVYQEVQTPESQLTWFDLEGKKLSTVGDPARLFFLSLSPDGKQAMAHIDESDGSQLWKIDLARGIRTRFAFDARVASNAIWSPDSRQVVFAAFLGGSRTLQLQDANGSSPSKTILSGHAYAYPASWSSDGQVIAFFSETEATKSLDIGILDLKGNRDPWFLVAGPADEDGGQFSPNGRWLAYFSHESGEWEDYVVPFPGPGGKSQISLGGNGGPFCFWNGNDQILILSHDRKVLAVDLAARGESLDVGASHPIFGGATMPNVALDYSPLLKRFLLAVPIREQKATSLSLVSNWAASFSKE